MTAIIEIGGKQYRVSEGDTLYIEKLPEDIGQKVVFDKVLAVLGDTNTFGAPLVNGASVTALIEKTARAKKITVYKMHPKKGYRRKQGHRQPYTKVLIEKITV